MKQIIYFKTIILFVCLWPFTNMTAQLSTNEKPVSFGRETELQIKQSSLSPLVTMPLLDMVKIDKEDKEDEENDALPRFGYRHKVNYNLNNSGIWYELSNGDKLWQLEVICPEALSVNLCYDKFWIPEGGKFFVYSKNKKYSIGAFTSKNNKGDRERLRGFATGLVYGSDIILEYYQPKEISTDAIISIEYVVHGYRYVYWSDLPFGSTGDCMVNVNCEEGQNWQEDKKAIAKVFIENFRYCTGSLLNTTNLSEAPLFMTANHCIYDLNKDAEGDSILDHTIFYWNYETSGCINDSIGTYYSTSGAIILANHSYGDFALLRLLEDPQDISDYTPYYLGWDNSGNSGEPGACIHHPNGDVKKISIPNAQPYSTGAYETVEDLYRDHWCITSWRTKQNALGIVAQGSSGSPLLNASHKVIGQLHGGDSKCNGNVNGPEWFGKFSSAWTGDSSSSNDTIYRRMCCWLDSLNTWKQIMEGLLIIPTTRTISTDQQLYSNIRIKSTGQLTIQSDIELMGNSRVIVESGGKLIIDGGKLSNVDIDLKVGASLRIINGGVMETRTGFKAPVGAKVDIVHGKIL